MQVVGEQAGINGAPERSAVPGTVKIAHLADLHLDVAFKWAGREAGGRWRRSIRATLTKAVEVALEEGVDAFFLGGDIYEHDLVAPDTARFMVEALARLDPIPVLVAPGNHDYLCPSSVWVQASWSPNVRYFAFDRWEAVELVDGLTIWGTAHGRPAGTSAMLDDLRVDRGGVNLGLFHGALRSGVPAGGSAPDLHLPFELADIERAGLDHAFSGHYHTPRHDRWLTYPGNPHPLSFGESPGTGLAIATVHPDGAVEVVMVDVTPTRFHDLTVDLIGVDSTEAVRDRVSADLAGLRGAARVTLVGDLASDVDFEAAGLRDFQGQLDALIFRTGDLRPGYDLDTLQLESTVRGQFVRDVLERTDLTDDRREAVLVTGLRALDGRNDLGVAL